MAPQERLKESHERFARAKAYLSDPRLSPEQKRVVQNMVSILTNVVKLRVRALMNETNKEPNLRLPELIDPPEPADAPEEWRKHLLDLLKGKHKTLQILSAIQFAKEGLKASLEYHNKLLPAVQRRNAQNKASNTSSQEPSA